MVKYRRFRFGAEEMKRPDMLQKFTITFLFVFHTLAGEVGGVSGEAGSLAIIPIPSAYAQIVDQFDRGKSGVRVIHIQDAHCVMSAQEQIGNLIEWYWTQNGGEGPIHVLMEGALGEVETSFLAHFPDEKGRREISRKQMKEGLLNGVERLAIDHPEYGIRIHGIEEPELYVKNFWSFVKVMQGKEKKETLWKALDEKLEGLRKEIYGKELKGWMERMKNWQEGKISTMEWANSIGAFQRDEHLSSLPHARQTSVERGAMVGEKNSELMKLLEVMEKEKAIDQGKVQKKFKEVMEELQKRMDKPALKKMIGLELKFRLGKVDRAQYYEQLRSIMELWGLNIKNYPQLDRLMILEERMQGIHWENVNGQLEMAAEQVIKKCMQTSRERTLVEFEQFLNRYRDGMELKLRRQDWEVLEKDLEGAVNVDEMITKLELKGQERAGLKESFDELIQNKKEIENFYHLAKEREKVFLEKVKNFLKNKNTGEVFLVTGGFHTEGILENFKKEGIPYVSVIPKMKGAIRANTYEKRMMDRRLIYPARFGLALASILDPLIEAISEKGAEALREALLLDYVGWLRQHGGDERAWRQPNFAGKTTQRLLAAWEKASRMPADELQTAGLDKNRVRGLMNLGEPVSSLLKEYLKRIGKEELLERTGEAVRRLSEILGISESQSRAFFRHIEEEYAIGNVEEVQAMRGGTGLQSGEIPVLVTSKGKFLVKRLKGLNRQAADFVSRYVCHLQDRGIPIPTLRKKAGTGALGLLTIEWPDERSGETSYYSLDRWADGKGISRKDAAPETLQEVGRLLAVIHDASRELSLPDGNLGHHDIRDVIRRLLDPGVPSRFQKILGDEDCALITSTVQKIGPVILSALEKFPRQAIPSDMNFGNMVFDPSQGSLAGVFDWDQARIGYRIEDFFATLVQTGRPGEGFYIEHLVEDLKTFLRAYQKTSQFPLTIKEMDILPSLYIIQILAHLVYDPALFKDDELGQARLKKKFEFFKKITEAFAPYWEKKKSLSREIMDFSKSAQHEKIHLFEVVTIENEEGRPVEFRRAEVKRLSEFSAEERVLAGKALRRMAAALPDHRMKFLNMAVELEQGAVIEDTFLLFDHGPNGEWNLYAVQSFRDEGETRIFTSLARSYERNPSTSVRGAATQLFAYTMAQALRAKKKVSIEHTLPRGVVEGHFKGGLMDNAVMDDFLLRHLGNVIDRIRAGARRDVRGARNILAEILGEPIHSDHNDLDQDIQKMLTQVPEGVRTFLKAIYDRANRLENQNDIKPFLACFFAVIELLAESEESYEDLRAKYAAKIGIASEATHSDAYAEKVWGLLFDGEEWKNGLRALYEALSAIGAEQAFEEWMEGLLDKMRSQLDELAALDVPLEFYVMMVEALVGRDERLFQKWLEKLDPARRGKVIVMILDPLRRDKKKLNPAHLEFIQRAA